MAVVEAIEDPKTLACLLAVLADKGYDSDALLDYIASLGAQAVIPSRRNRRQARQIDRELYKARNKPAPC